MNIQENYLDTYISSTRSHIQTHIERDHRLSPWPIVCQWLIIYLYVVCCVVFHVPCMLRMRRVCHFNLTLLSYRTYCDKCNCICSCSCVCNCICMVYVFRTVFRSHSVFTYIYLLFIRTVVAKFTMNFSYPSRTHTHTHRQRHRIRETVGNRRPLPSCGFSATTLRHSSLLSLSLPLHLPLPLRLPPCLGQVSSWRASFSLPGNS